MPENTPASPEVINLPDYFIHEMYKTEDGDVRGSTAFLPSKWSSEQGFIHGPDVMMPVGMALMFLLQKGEKIITIDSLRFNHIMPEQLDFVASFTPPPINQSHVYAQFTCDVEGETRHVYFTAATNEAPLPHPAIQKPVINPTALALTNQFYTQEPLFDTHSNIRTLPLAELSVDDQNSYARMPQAYHMATFLEVLTWVHQYHVLKELITPGDYSLSLGVEQFMLPKEPKDLVSGECSLQVCIRDDLRKPTGKGGCIYPWEIYLVKNDNRIAGGICNYYY